MQHRKEILHRWRLGRRLLHEIERAEAGCKDDGRPYPRATLRAYRNRLPHTREQLTRNGHELTLLAERTWVTWRAWHEGSEGTRRGPTAHHLRVLVGGRA